MTHNRPVFRFEKGDGKNLVFSLTFLYLIASVNTFLSIAFDVAGVFIRLGEPP
jgi:hypothetical protein